MGKAKHNDDVVVIGLGRFGSALAETLVGLGHEVLGIDANPKVIQTAASRLTHVVEADGTNIEAMRQLGVGDFARGVVAIGTGIEASILTTSVLSDLKLPNIWAKAINAPQGRILERVGAHHVVFPEHDMGERVAHLVAGRMLDYLELDTGFALVKTRAPAELVGQTLAEAKVRRRYAITVVCIKPEGQSYTFATPDTLVGANDLLVVAGEPRYAEGFAELS